MADCAGKCDMGGGNFYSGRMNGLHGNGGAGGLDKAVLRVNRSSGGDTPDPTSRKLENERWDGSFHLTTAPLKPNPDLNGPPAN